MKTTVTTKKISLLKLTRTLAVVALMGSGITAGAQCSANYTYTIDSSDNGVVSFLPSYTGTAAPEFTWDFGDGGSVGAPNVAHTYLTGTYTACLYMTDSTGSCADTVCYTFSVVNNPPAPTPSCGASFVIIQDSTDSYTYYVYPNAVSPSPTADYAWTFGDGTIIIGQYPTHTYAGTGPYYLCLTVVDTMYDGSGMEIVCADTYCDSVAAGRSSTGITVTVVAPVSTGISEQHTATLLENYPNPFSGSTTIRYSVSADAAVELNVMDLLGNKVAALENGRRSAGSYSINWNAENAAAGMYLLQMRTNNTVTIKKIIINK